jgi:hypothetical protein
MRAQKSWYTAFKKTFAAVGCARRSSVGGRGKLIWVAQRDGAVRSWHPLCHAENPEAVKIFVESARYPFAREGLPDSTRNPGNGSQNFAAQIWGYPPTEYMLKGRHVGR